MDIQQAKAAFLHEAAREKRIVLRNTIVLSVLILAIIGVLLVYVKDALFHTISSIGEKAANKGGIESYLPYIVVLGLGIYVYFSIRSSMKRKDTVEKAFALIEKGGKVVFYSEDRKSLTNLPLLVVMLKLDPIYYLNLEINKGMYTLPLPEVLLTDVKRVLENGEDGQYDQVMDSIYTDKSVEAPVSADTPTEKEYEVELRPLETFSTFFTESFGTEMNAMEEARKSTKKKTMTLFVGIIVLVIIVVLFLITEQGQKFFAEYGQVPFLIGFFVLSGGVGYLYTMAAKKKAKEAGADAVAVDYTKFKKTMLTRMAQYIHPNYKYFENGHIGLPELFHSRIFEEKVYKLSGGDQFIGQYKGVPFQSCDLGLTFRPNFRKEKEEDDVVFAGNYFVAKFPKNFQANILIFPNKGVMSSFTNNDISTYLNTSGQKIQLEDPEFQKLFTVYCEDQIAARYVLTPAFMEKIKELSQTGKGNMYFAINGNNIVIASNVGMSLESTADLVGNIFNTTKLDQAFLDKKYIALTSQLRVIDALKLSKEIWQA